MTAIHADVTTSLPLLDAAAAAAAAADDDGDDDLDVEIPTVYYHLRRRDGLIILVVALDSRVTPNCSSLLLLWSSSSTRWDTIY